MNSQEKLENLIGYVTSNRRIHPNNWLAIYDLGRDEVEARCISEEFPRSLILAASGASNADKQRVFLLQLRFAAKHGFLDALTNMIMEIPENGWSYGSLNKRGYFDILAVDMAIEEEIADQGHQLCTRLFELEGIELVPDYRNTKVALGKTTFSEHELCCYFRDLQCLYSISVESIEILIEAAQIGFKELKALHEWPASERNPDDWVCGKKIQEKDKHEIFWESRLTDHEVMILRLELLRLYECYITRMLENNPNLGRENIRDFGDFSEFIWDKFDP